MSVPKVRTGLENLVPTLRIETDRLLLTIGRMAVSQPVRWPERFRFFPGWPGLVLIKIFIPWIWFGNQALFIINFNPFRGVRSGCLWEE